MDTDGARSFWVTGPGRGEIRVEKLPAPASDDVVVRALFSGISRGTEALVWSGAVPESEFERMRAPFQAGAFPAPVKYGYSSVGIVENGPNDLAGRAVFCLHPHQTRYVVPSSAVYALPADVPPARAVLAANLETAVNGLWDAAPRIGDRIAVVGAGSVGCLTAWLAGRIAGCEVELVDVDSRKAAIAKELGVAFRSNEQASRGADLVIHASGAAGGLATALGLAGFEATVLEMSWYGDQRPKIPLGEAFHSQRLTIKSSQVGAVATAQRSRWSLQRRMQLVLKLLAAPALDALISGESRFDDLPATMATMARLGASADYTLCHRIAY